MIAPYAPDPPPATWTPAPAWIHPDREKGWIRRMLPVLRPHVPTLAGALAASATMLCLQVSVPLVVRNAINDSLLAHRRPLAPYVGVILALGAGMMLLGFVQTFGMRRASVEIETQLRTMFFEHLGRLSFPFYDRTQSGQLISRANSDVRQIQMFLAFGPMIAVQMLTFVAAFALMLRISVGVTLVTAATLPLVYMAGLSMRRRLWPISWLLQARAADIATIAEENITGVRVVKSFVAEKAQLGLLERAARKWRWVFVQQMRQTARFQPFMMNLPRASMALLLLYGGHLVITGGLNFGSFVACTQYAVMLQTPFVMIGFLIQMGQSAAASAQRVIEVLDEVPDIVDRPGAVDLIGSRGAVSFEEVDFSYDGVNPVLSGFDLHLRPGETVALVGRTGSGKSTVARLLCRFYDVSGGRIVVDGRDVRDLTLASLRASVGLVLEEPFLFSATVRDNIAFGRPDASMEDVVAAARAAGADEFIRALSDGYATTLGERGYTLSGGQRQRVAIARTLLANPPILVLDDATSSIDAHREQEIHGALQTLMEGRTTLIIAHRLSTISLAGRVLVLDDGRVVADGTHEELLAGFPLYSEILARGLEADEGVTDEVPDQEVMA